MKDIACLVKCNKMTKRDVVAYISLWREQLRDEWKKEEHIIE